MYQNRKKNNSDIYPILLAAGCSKRLGFPKQLLKYKSQSFIARSLSVSNSITQNKTIIVIGSNASKIRLALNRLQSNYKIIYNKKWKEGIAESLKIGRKNINSKAKAILILSCDQPFINKSHIFKLISSWKMNKNNIIAASYNNTFGIPIILPKKFFYLLNLTKEDKGAKQIIKSKKKYLKLISIPEAAIDIDTKEDQKKFLSINSIL
ncbi:MAG: hypothetical protein CBC38_04360 [Gammaproteobacteria bacterium TMED78]|nr:MAG: hypothetical protein CBC38_04360 [Gammaproteobacteria bacterium TMED78]|tara:strand:+ start:76997 stop:77620 length:624 start_codon:yes stop_codon:yes gene_type:complete